MPDELYCCAGSNVLKNKMRIQDKEQLHETERKLTMLRILELLDKPVRGAFDLKHLQVIHAYIFHDVYDWAGGGSFGKLILQRGICSAMPCSFPGRRRRFLGG